MFKAKVINVKQVSGESISFKPVYRKYADTALNYLKRQVSEHLDKIDNVRIALYSKSDYGLYEWETTILFPDNSPIYIQEQTGLAQSAFEIGFAQQHLSWQDNPCYETGTMPANESSNEYLIELGKELANEDPLYFPKNPQEVE